MLSSGTIHRNHVLILWVLVVIWATFIFFMSAHTGNDLDSSSGIIGWIKHNLTLLAEGLFGKGTDAVSVIAHFLEYLVFGVLLTAAIFFSRCYALLQSGVLEIDWRRVILISVVLAIALASIYGVTDEFHQAFVPGRVCDPADWLTDTLGAALGSFITSLLMLKQEASYR